MPVSDLLVEGKLDSTILTAILGGRPTVTMGGSKTSLKPRVVDQRAHGNVAVCYLRDRDFDSDPPEDRTRPLVHERDQKSGEVLGFSWCRHEMESYLLEPALVARAMGCDEAAYRAALVDAARRIRDYQAARAAIGITRRSLPPAYKFQTSPDEIPDDSLRLPEDLTAEGVRAWACTQAAQFRDRICPQLDPAAVALVIEQRRAILSDDLLGVTDELLAWLSGKDLMGALGPWLVGRCAGPKDFRIKLRDWVRDHPEEALSILPEWANFVAMLQ